MTDRPLQEFGLAWILCWTVASAAWAQTQFAGPMPMSDDSVAARLAAVETELAALRSGGGEPAGLALGGIKEPACEPSASAYAGFAFVWAKPHFKEAFQATSYAPPADTTTLIGYDYDYGLAPRVWLGFERPDGLGFRAGYWHYDHSGNTLNLVSTPTMFPGAQTITVSVPAIIQTTGVGQLLTASSGLEVQTLDVEGTLQLQIGETSAVAGAGVRYGRMVQDNQAMISGGGLPDSILNRRRRFEGFGPTLGADLLRPVGSGNLAIAAGMRGSLLFGDKSYDRFAANVAGGVPGSFAMDVDDFTFTAELSVGLQWTRELAFGDVALRGGYEGSFWIDAGEPVLTLLGFEGFALSLIVTY